MQLTRLLMKLALRARLGYEALQLNAGVRQSTTIVLKRSLDDGLVPMRDHATGAPEHRAWRARCGAMPNVRCSRQGYWWLALRARNYWKPCS